MAGSSVVTPLLPKVACDFIKKFHSSVMHSPQRKILFVCMGNICRSPAAEIIFRDLVQKADRHKEFLIDSAGTIGLHQGNPPDARMRRHLAQKGYQVFGSSRKIVANDLATFDLILVMDEANERDVKSLDPHGHYQSKIRRLTDFSNQHQMNEVPDPYYGGEEGFAQVVELIEDSCSGLLRSLS